jgi:hypothetical protein
MLLGMRVFNVRQNMIKEIKKNANQNDIENPAHPSEWLSSRKQ